MAKVNLNVVVDDQLLEQLNDHTRGDRNGYRTEVKRAHPIEGVSVTVADEFQMDSGPHSMTTEELLEWLVYQLAHNRTSKF